MDEPVPSNIFGRGAWRFSCRLWPAWLCRGDKARTRGRCLDDIVPPQGPPTCLWNPFQTHWDTPQCETQTSDSEGSRDYGGQRVALRGLSSERGCNEVHVKSLLLQMRELLDASQPRQLSCRSTRTYKHSRCFTALRIGCNLDHYENIKNLLRVAGAVSILKQLLVFVTLKKILRQIWRSSKITSILWNPNRTSRKWYFPLRKVTTP